jgi:hypothetical protein
MKFFVVGLVVLIAGMGLGAQEAPIALPESSWPEPGRVTEMRVIHDLQGGVYIPYIAGSAFQVLRSGAGGKLDPYVTEGFDGGPLAARNLKAISDGPERYIAFIGGSGGESVYLFGFGFWDALSYYPLPEAKAAAITDYALVSFRNGGVAVYTLAEGRLRSFSTGIRGGAPWQARELSRPGEIVEAFGVHRERNQEITYGWYRVARKDYWEIILFALNDGGNLVFENTRFWSHIPRLEYGVSPEGKAVFAIIAGSAVSVFHAEGSLFVGDLYFEAPFAVKRYSPALLTGGPVGLLTGEREGADVLYGVSHERSGAPALRDLFARPSAEILGLFFTEDKRISLLYRSDRILGAALLYPEGGIISDRPLPVSAERAALFQHPLGRTRMYAISGSGELRSLSTFEFEGGAWRLAGEAQIPGVSPEEIHSPLGFRNRELIPMASPEALMLYDAESSGRQILETTGYALSAAHNGVVYLAFSSEKGISLCRIEE